MSDRKQIGFLWIREAIKDGVKKQYMAGMLHMHGRSQKIPILVFRAKKTQDDSPDFIIMEGKDELSEMIESIGGVN